MKRLFDIFFSILGLVILMPVFIVAGILVRKDGGPTFYCQQRVGKGGKRFRLIKFRSMMVNADKLGVLVTAGADPRITKIGYFLRNTKIDELPQLVNVFCGHMSLVGPRPEVPRYVDAWTEADRRKILSILPGITDYASLIYSNEQEVLAGSVDPEKTYLKKVMPKKLLLYRKYIKERTLWVDLRIILATLLKLVGLDVAFFVPELRNQTPK